MSDKNLRRNPIEIKIKDMVRRFLLRIRFKKTIDNISSLGKISVGTAWPNPEMKRTFNAQKILVIAPHADDDVIGCGGTLKRFYESGSHLKIIIMTDGRKATGTVDEQGDLVNIRMEEEKLGAGILGCSDLVFLNNFDLSLRANKDNKKAILNVLNDFNPDIIFVPSIFEHHPDHIESTLILAYALREYRGNPLCYCYEVWSPLFPNTLIDITNKVEDKVKALNAHWSQVTHQNFVDSILGLNSYRAFGWGTEIKFCEAFYKCSKEEFIKIAFNRI
jgi:LmbE family N-acetylglucosaminyl deacetylase